MTSNILINGSAETLISPLDRGLHYGDGLFETILIESSCPIFLTEHFNRLHKGCDVIGFPALDIQLIKDELLQVIGNNKQGVAKVIITRGVGDRGFLAPNTPSITRIVSFDTTKIGLSETLQQVELIKCETSLSRQPLLAGLKHLNQLERVIARGELIGEGLIEGLMLDTHGNVVEGIMSNLFIAKDNILKTPSLKHCGVSGVIRDFLVKKANIGEIQCKETEISLDDIQQADEIFMTNSLILVRAVNRFVIDTDVFHKEQSTYAKWAFNSVVGEVKYQIKTS